MAGGLGTLGASWTDPALLREQIRSVMRATDRPFCVNLVLDFEQGERLEVAVEERVPWVSFSFGLHLDLVARARAGGARALVQVASADAPRGGRGGRRRADRAGRRGRRPCAERRRAAGAVGRGAPGRLAAARGRGRDRRSCLGTRRGHRGRGGGGMGTRFVASEECDAHPRYKARLLEAEARHTVLTELFDVGWDAPHRVLRNSTYERWEAEGQPAAGRPPGRGRGGRAAAYRATRSTCRWRASRAMSRRWRCMPAKASAPSTPWSRPRRSSSASPLVCDPGRRLQASSDARCCSPPRAGSSSRSTSSTRSRCSSRSRRMKPVTSSRYLRRWGRPRRPPRSRRAARAARRRRRAA